jgi:hypothetical protein
MKGETPMTPQEIFDTVSEHLLKQGRRSIKYGECMYRGPRGMKCAAGAIIPDDLYLETFESRAPTSSNIIDRMPAWWAENIDLICQLQRLHDFFDPYFWREELIMIAATHNLSAAKIGGAS